MSGTDWQHPFVDVFRQFDSSNRSMFQSQGDVRLDLDPAFGKKVYKISGDISAKNYLLIPGQDSRVPSLKLTGAYVYLQIKAHNNRLFVINITLDLPTKSSVVLSLSNMYKQVKCHAKQIQYPCHLFDRWTVVCIHLPSLLSTCMQQPSSPYLIRSIRFGSMLSVRNMFTSDILYLPQSMPRPMRFSSNPQIDREWGKYFHWLDIPQSASAPGSSIANNQILFHKGSTSKEEIPILIHEGSTQERPKFHDLAGARAAKYAHMTDNEVLTTLNGEIPAEMYSLLHNPSGSSIVTNLQPESAEHFNLPRFNKSPHLSPNRLNMTSNLHEGNDGDVSKLIDKYKNNAAISNRFLSSKQLLMDRSQPAQDFHLSGSHRVLDAVRTFAHYPCSQAFTSNSSLSQSLTRQNNQFLNSQMASFINDPLTGSKYIVFGSGCNLVVAGTSNSASINTNETLVLLGSTNPRSLKNGLANNEDGENDIERRIHSDWQHALYIGHTLNVGCVAARNDLVISVQEVRGSPANQSEKDEKTACVRLWQVQTGESRKYESRQDQLESLLNCFSVMYPPGLVSVSVVRIHANGRKVALVGLDAQGRHHIQIWDVRIGVAECMLVARQVSEFAISDLQWVDDFDDTRLASCGRENIRFWRVKNSHLPACSVVLDSIGRGAVFRTIGLHDGKIFVGSSTGSIVVVDCNSRAVVQVLDDVHESDILAISAADGLIASGGVDGKVKIWPAEGLRTPLVELRQETAIASLNLSGKGADMELLVASSSGDVGILLVAAETYEVVSRGFEGQISSICQSQMFKEVYTADSSGAIRIWNIPKLEESFMVELDQGKTATFLACHPFRHLLAAGLEDGTVQIFDLDPGSDSDACVMSTRNHVRSISGLVFCIKSGLSGYAIDEIATILLSACRDGSITILDESLDFEPLRTLPPFPTYQPPPANCPVILANPARVPGAISDSNRGFGISGEILKNCAIARYVSNRGIQILGIETLSSTSGFDLKDNFEIRIPKDSFATETSIHIRTFAFAMDGTGLGITSSDFRLRIYKFLADGSDARCVLDVNLSSGYVSSLWFSSADALAACPANPLLAVTSGSSDKLLKLWDLTACPFMPENNKSLISNDLSSPSTANTSGALRTRRNDVFVSVTTSDAPVSRTEAISRLKDDSLEATADRLKRNMPPPFHAYGGHSLAASNICVTSGLVFSSSANELIMWEPTGKSTGILETIFNGVQPIFQSNSRMSNFFSQNNSKVTSKNFGSTRLKKQTPQELPPQQQIENFKPFTHSASPAPPSPPVPSPFVRPSSQNINNDKYAKSEEIKNSVLANKFNILQLISSSTPESTPQPSPPEPFRISPPSTPLRNSATQSMSRLPPPLICVLGGAFIPRLLSLSAPSSPVYWSPCPALLFQAVGPWVLMQRLSETTTNGHEGLLHLSDPFSVLSPTRPPAVAPRYGLLAANRRETESMPVRALFPSDNGKLLVTLHADPSADNETCAHITVWSTSTSRELATSCIKLPPIPLNSDFPLMQATFIKEGKLLVTCTPRPHEAPLPGAIQQLRPFVLQVWDLNRVLPSQPQRHLVLLSRDKSCSVAQLPLLAEVTLSHLPVSLIPLPNTHNEFVSVGGRSALFCKVEGGSAEAEESRRGGAAQASRHCGDEPDWTDEIMQVEREDHAVLDVPARSRPVGEPGELFFAFGDAPATFEAHPSACYISAAVGLRDRFSVSVVLATSNMGRLYAWDSHRACILFEANFGVNVWAHTLLSGSGMRSVAAGMKSGGAIGCDEVRVWSLDKVWKAVDDAAGVKIISLDIETAVVRRMDLDGCILSMQLDAELREGVVSTGANSTWYVHLGQKQKALLASSHSTPIKKFTRSWGAESSTRMCMIASCACEPDLTIRIWKQDDPGFVQQGAFSISQICLALQFDPKTGVLVGAFADGVLRFFDAVNVRVLGRLSVSTAKDPPNFLTCAGGKVIVGFGYSGRVCAVDISLRTKGGNLVDKLANSPKVVSKEVKNKNSSYLLEVETDTRLSLLIPAVSASKQGSVRIESLEGEAPSMNFKNVSTGADIHGGVLAIAYNDGSLEVFDISNGSVRNMMKGKINGHSDSSSHCTMCICRLSEVHLALIISKGGHLSSIPLNSDIDDRSRHMKDQRIPGVNAVIDIEEVLPGSLPLWWTDNVSLTYIPISSITQSVLDNKDHITSHGAIPDGLPGLVSVGTVDGQIFLLDPITLKPRSQLPWNRIWKNTSKMIENEKDIHKSLSLADEFVDEGGAGDNSLKALLSAPCIPHRGGFMKMRNSDEVIIGPPPLVEISGRLVVGAGASIVTLLVQML